MQSNRADAKWLTELASPKNRVEIDFHAVPSLYVARVGWNTQARLSGQHLFYYGAHGSFRVRMEKREELVGAGDLIWIPPGMPFHCWLPDKAPASFYRFRLNVTDGGGRVLGAKRSAMVAHSLESARPWIEEIVRTGHQTQTALRTWRLRGALLGLFADVLAPKSSKAVAGRLTASQRETLVSWMNQHATGQVTPAMLAVHLHLSPDYFARLFQRTFTISPRAWIVRERIKMAGVRLLESQLSIGEVAEEFGYSDIFFFSRQFKQVMGRSPKQYRREA